MPVTLRHQIILLVLAAILFLVNLGGAAIFNNAEARHAGAAAEMASTKSWIIPTFNQNLKTDNPILSLWILMGSYMAFGVSEFSARLPSAVFAIGTTLLTYQLGKKLYSPEVGFFAGFILCTTLFFSIMGRLATPDSAFVFFLTLSFFAFVWGTTPNSADTFYRPPRLAKQKVAAESVDEDSEEDDAVAAPPSSRISVLGLYLPIGLAVLTKGISALILPCVCFWIFIVLSQWRDELKAGTIPQPTGTPWDVWRKSAIQLLNPLRMLRAIFEIKFVIGIVIVAIVTIPWFAVVSMATHMEWLHRYAEEVLVGSFVRAQGGNNGFPLYQLYHMIMVLFGCLPWGIFLPVAGFRLWERISYGSSWGDSDRLVACWCVTWIAVYSLLTTRVPGLLLPIYPALAIILGRYFADWKREKGSSEAYSFIVSCRAMWVVGLSISLCLIVMTYLYFPTEQWWGLIGLVIVIGGLIAPKFLEQENRRDAMRTVMASCVLFTVLLVVVAPSDIRQYQDTPQFVDDAKRFAGTSDVQIASYSYFEPSLVFYAKQSVAILDTPQKVQEFLTRHPHGFVITKQDRFIENDLRELLIGVPTPLSKHKNFLSGRDLVMWGSGSFVAPPLQ